MGLQAPSGVLGPTSEVLPDVATAQAEALRSGRAAWLSDVPGLGPGARWRQALAGAGYALLALTTFVLPAFGLAILTVVLLLANPWNLRSRVPLLRSNRRVLASVGWVMVASATIVAVGSNSFLLLSTGVYGTVIAIVYWLVLLGALPIALTLAIWDMTGAGSAGLRQRVLGLALLWVFPPAGFVMWHRLGISRRKSRLALLGGYAWTHFAWAAAIVVVVSLLDAGSFGENPLKGLLDSSPSWARNAVPRFTAIGLVIVTIIALERLAFHLVSGKYPVAIGWSALLTRLAIFIGCLTGWAGIIAIGLGPWLIAAMRSPASYDLEGPIFVLTMAAAAPIAILSFRSLVGSLVDVVRHSSADWRPASQAFAGAFLLALALDLSRVLFNILFPVAPWLGASISIGLGIGLSVGLAREFRLGRGWVGVSSGLVAVSFCAVLVGFLILSDHWGVLALEALAGLAVGLLAADLLLIPGLKAFARTAAFLQKMIWPLLGFAVGYAFLALTFAGVYYAASRMDAHAFDPAGARSLGQAVLFSINHLAPGDYPDMHGRLPWIHALTTTESIAGLIWTVVIFAAMVSSIASPPEISRRSDS